MQDFNHTLLQHENLYGLIGYPLSHSFSKEYFSQKFNTEQIADSFYELFPIEKMELMMAIVRSHPNLRGLNVTIPYKEQVLGYLNKLDESARAIGAVNCIKIENGLLFGYNTDAYGFEQSLRAFLQQHQTQPQQALILGTGGAAKAVAFILKKLEIRFITVSREARKGDCTYSDLTSLQHYPLIINTTPLGMSPDVATCPPLSYEQLTDQHLLYDLVYNPTQTLFLQKGAAQGAATQNGLPMLYYQAEQAWRIWQEQATLPYFNRTH